MKLNGKPDNVFNVEERYDKEIAPLISELCQKAQELGAPIFVVTCYKNDEKGGSWLASSARGRGDFVPQQFYIIRAVVEGQARILEINPPE